MPQRQQITYTGSPFKWEPDKYGNIAFDYSKVGTGEGGARWGDKAHYQAVYPEISLENYALKYAPKNNNKAYMIQNITNPDTYYNLDLSLQEQPRFIRNIVSNSQYYNDINPEILSNVLDNAMAQEVIDKYTDEFYDTYKNMNSYGRKYMNNKEEARQILSDTLYGTNYNPESYKFRNPANYILNKVGKEYLNKAKEYFENQGIDPIKIDTDEFNTKQKEFALEKILKENNGEIPQRLLKDKNLERIINKANNFISLNPNDADYLGDIIAKGGGSGISPTSFQDDKIYVTKRGDFTHSFPIDSSLADEVAEAMVTHKGTDPFWNMYKENLKIPAIQQTHTGKTLEDIKANAQERYSNLKNAYATDKQINDMLYGKDKSILEPSFKPTETKLSTPAKSINKQTSKPQAQVKQPIITPKQVDVPLGARLYEAGLNPKELVKLAKDPKVLSEVTKSLGKVITNPKTYLELGRGLISPTNIGLIASDILVNKADQAVHNRLKGKYDIKSQVEFNKLYPTLSTFERGQLGNTYPEMYQSYMKGR